MTQTKIFPKVEAIEPLKNKCVLVTFDNGAKKLYNCKPLLKEEVFSRLSEDWFFKMVKKDTGGYGISWDDEIDLSEAELWKNGRLVDQTNTAKKS